METLQIFSQSLPLRFVDIDRPEDFSHALLLIEGREVEFIAGETVPVGPWRERTGRRTDRELKEPFRKAQKWQEFGQKAIILPRQNVNVAGHHRVKLCHCNFALISPALAK